MTKEKLVSKADLEEHIIRTGNKMKKIIDLANPGLPNLKN